jgi:Raf kinase inhibitor-like YbhB/YbcL family protein
MKINQIAIISAALAASAFLAAGQNNPPAAKKGSAGPGLTLTTTAFEDGGVIPIKYSQQDPKGVSPKLTWTNVPAGTVTFAMIFHDPDVAPAKGTEDNLHWIAFNIPGEARELPEAIAEVATLPDGTIQTKNRRGVWGYMGPGAGAAGPYHHYTFELYALDTKLNLTQDTTRTELLKAMDGHVLGKGVVFGRFHRTQ